MFPLLFCFVEIAAQGSVFETRTKSSRESNLIQEHVVMDANASRAVVNEICPKCNHKKMYFYTMQLRSADEGQTVFYECMKNTCKYKYSVNT
jgi:DNA-directed RNA polymerase I subunit RPA12